MRSLLLGQVTLVLSPTFSSSGHLTLLSVGCWTPRSHFPGSLIPGRIVPCYMVDCTTISFLFHILYIICIDAFKCMKVDNQAWYWVFEIFNQDLSSTRSCRSMLISIPLSYTMCLFFFSSIFFPPLSTSFIILCSGGT